MDWNNKPTPYPRLDNNPIGVPALPANPINSAYNSHPNQIGFIGGVQNNTPVPPPAAALSYPMHSNTGMFPHTGKTNPIAIGLLHADNLVKDTSGITPKALPTTLPANNQIGFCWKTTNTRDCRMLERIGFIVGHDRDGCEIYVGRSVHQADILPARIVPRKNMAHVTYNGHEIQVQNFEMLVRSEATWVQSRNGSVPPGALPVGHTMAGEILFAGRVHTPGGITMGKVHPSHGCCYIPFNGKEEAHKVYEVLVVT